MMNTHTPGPWRVADLGPKIRRFEIHSNHGDQYTVASVYINSANARLIAAAPALLGALERLLEWVEEGQSHKLDACIDKARATIAQAKGETV